MTARGPRLPAAMVRAMVGEDFADAVPDDPAPARHAGGRHAAEHGRDLERRLRAQHRAFEAAGLGVASQCGPAIIGADANGPRFARGPCDFMGGIVVDGALVALAVEAKSRPARVLLSDFAEHQAQLLSAVEGLGGVSVAVLELRDVGRVYALRWGDLELRWNRARGGASVGLTELNGRELVSAPGGYLTAFTRRTAR